MELLVSDNRLVSGSRWLLFHAVAVFAFPVFADCNPYYLFVQRRGRGRVSAASSHSRLVSHAFRRWADLGFGAQQLAGGVCRDGDFADLRRAGGAGSGAGAVSGESLVPSIGALAADSAGHYHRAFAADVIQRDGNKDSA